MKSARVLVHQCLSSTLHPQSPRLLPATLVGFRFWSQTLPYWLGALTCHSKDFQISHQHHFLVVCNFLPASMSGSIPLGFFAHKQKHNSLHAVYASVSI